MSADAYAQAKSDVQVLASVDFAGRANDSDGSRLAQNYLRARFKETGLEALPQAPDFSHRFSLSAGLTRVEGVNLVGKIAGQHSSQYIVITAHYDHLGRENGQMYLGADDNASGVAAMLFLASYVAENPLYHSVLFIATDAEERGLFGARAVLEQPLIERDKLLMNLNLDMLARVGKPARLYLSGEKTHASFMGITRAVNQQMAALSADPIKVIKAHRQPKGRRSLLNQINYRRASDHAVFAEYDIAYLFFGVGDHRHYHTPYDTAENIDFEQFNIVLETAKALSILADAAMQDTAVK
ncbi:M20/M25/M40 family metallo-hydrolase [Alteromonas oceanisediminis]|uniref:M20/M25/M40 family metallo-hydrolase n=1 Tax=Alteromonas oceanisediminis TaxID=2836180 RepID=UPI001BDA127E|nr:M20/M25/M40 family metallo-hydrolase [Alteromonas oceanisediminis]MBT0585927.1 M28 family peptidase [Alteromonas oceanisediminis]